ncbi:MAG TPA: LolA-related protein, partial [Burkholderiaceae bacterium]
LAGDRNALEGSYRLDLSGSADAWQLVLIPTKPAMLKVISRIRIRGVHDDVRAIDFESADGDRFEMAITRISGP